MLGVMSLQEALKHTEQENLDLIEIAPNATPPVCKMMDYGRYKYQTQKKANQVRKKQKIIEVKEIKLRPNIDSNDYQVKIRNAEKFLKAKDKVKISMRFRGREITHQNLGFKLFERVSEELQHTAKVEQQVKLEGRQIVMILAPK